MEHYSSKEDLFAKSWLTRTIFSDENGKGANGGEREIAPSLQIPKYNSS
jgi:hypothetical protein